MSTNKYVDKICISVLALMLVITVFFMFSERFGVTVIHREEDEKTSQMFTTNDLNADWDTSNACNIVLSGNNAKISGNGAYFSNNTLYIAYAGKYILSGTLDGSIHIDADGDDKIWLLLDGVDITSKTEPPLYIGQADKVFLTLNENSQNTLTFENGDTETEFDGCIFSRDDLTVNGKGNLTVTSSGLHGIVCNDSIVFTGGNISITAKNDGVHAHDAIKICNTDFTVSAGDDGLHAGNDDETAVFYMESGNISITECYEGIEANDITITGGTVNIAPSDDGINANGSGKSSLITISGGDITIINKNGRDADGFDSNGSINITGGNIFICVTGTGTNNAVDYGSENGGKFTISGGTVVACGSSQMAEYPDSDSVQGFIMGTVSGGENEKISILDADGKEIISKKIPCSFTCVIISSPDIAVGDTVTLKVGDTQAEVTANDTESVGTGGFGNKGGFDFGGRDRQGDFHGQDGQNPFESEDGNTPPKFPNGSGEDNTPFELPNGGNGERPQRQIGMQRPRGNEQEENSSSTLEPPENNNQKQSDDFYGNHTQKGRDPISDSKTGNINDNKELLNKQSDISMSTWIMTGISVLVLISGLIIAVKKKY